MTASALLDLLEQARQLGFLGPGPVEAQYQRALAFAQVAARPQACGADLGTGGGVPGLVLASTWPDSRWLFIEANRRRAEWLTAAASTLGLDDRVTVLHDRAEDVGRGPWRGTVDLVTSRSFACPSATAECAAPLLRIGGTLVVTDPPDGSTSVEARWPVAGLRRVGLESPVRTVVSTEVGPVTLVAIPCRHLCPSQYPRRAGVPEKRPLF